MNAHQPEASEHGLKCAAEGCSWQVYGGIPESQWDWAIRSHRDQYEPGRAPDIEVDWTPSGWCPVCDRHGDLDMADDGEVVCPGCKTSWSSNGTGGCTAEGQA